MSLVRLENLKISGKLAVAFSVIVLLMMALGLFSISRLGKISAQNDFLVKARMASVIDASAMDEAIGQIRFLSYRLATTTESDVSQIRKAMDEALRTFEELRKGYSNSIGDPAEHALFDEAQARYAPWLSAYHEYHKLMAQDRRTDALILLNNDGKDVFYALKAPLGKLVDHNQQLAAKEADDSRETYILSRNLTLGCMLSAAILAALLAAFLARRIAEPLNKAVELSQAIAAGDLTRRLDVRGRDEVSDLLRALSSMRDNLVRTLTIMRESSDSVATASAQIASGSANLSSRTEQTASNLQETAASMEELTGSVSSSADAANQANTMAAAASEVATKGGNAVSEVVSTMRAIDASANKIAEIISTIDGIAFQTNILALNAAVEAARAGDQGRGFAVVANEVRSLAQRSATAAKEIKSLIGASLETVESGTRMVNGAGDTMAEIVSSVKRMAEVIGEISAAALDQSKGIGQVNAAVAQLDSMTQENSALVEESAAAADSLREQAQQLSALVEFFKLPNHGKASYATQRSPSGVESTPGLPTPPQLSKPAPLRIT